LTELQPHEAVVIALPSRDDSKTWLVGIITFKASRPIEIEIPYNYNQ
jgi:hypothetical protein